MRRLPLATSLLLLALTATAPGCARPPVTGPRQTVRLRLLPRVGQVAHFEMAVQEWMRTPGMTPADTAQPILEMTEHFTTTIIARKGGTWTESVVIDSVQTKSRMGSLVGRYAPRGTAVRTTFDSLGRKDSSEVTPPPGTPAVVSQSLRRTARMQGPSLLFPRRPVRVGASWTDSAALIPPLVLNAQEPLRGRITFRLERLEREGKDRVAVISSTTPIVVNGAAANVGAVSETGVRKGTYRFDVDTGRLLDETFDVNVKVKTSIGTGAVRTRMEIRRLN